MSGLHRKELWLTNGECLANGDTVAVAANCCGKAVSIGYRWRQHFLAWISADIKN